MNRAALTANCCSSLLSLAVGLAALQAGARLYGSDASFYVVKKGFRYTQASTAPPTSPDATNGYRFEADVYPAVSGFITNAWVTVSGSNVPTPLALISSETHFQFKNSKNSLGKMNSAFPDGTYKSAIGGLHDGLQKPALALLGDAYPLTPYVTNFPALQAVNANGYSVVAWRGYGSAPTPDFVRLTVSDAAKNNLYQSPNVYQQGAWGGQTAYAVIGPGNLDPNQTYTAALFFQKNVATNLASYPGALGLAAYFSETKVSLVTSGAAAPDVQTVEVTKSVQWIQTNSGPAGPDPAGTYQFKAEVDAYLPGALTAGSVAFPATSSGPTNRSLTLDPDLLTLACLDNVWTPQALDALYAQGNYTITFNTPHDGAKSLTLSLQSVTNAPPPPHFANFDAIRTVNASQPLSVSWDPWPGGGPGGFVQFRIEDLNGNKIYATPNLGAPKALNGGATNATIVGGTLAPGQTYRATITFNRLVGLNTTNYPGVLHLGNYRSRTELAISTLPADLAGYGISKGLVFTQTGAGSPAPLPSGGGVFTAQVQANAAGSVLGAAIITPSGLTNSLAPQAGAMGWSFTGLLPAKADLDSSFPFGIYTVQVSCAHDGQKVLPLPLLTASYPSAPHLTGYSAAQAIDSTADFTLAWDPCAGLGTPVFIQLTVSDTSGNLVFKTPDLGSPGALDGSATSALIPAGALDSNQSYQAALMFQGLEWLDTTNSPGATGLAAVSATTRFTLGTGASGNGPTLSLSLIGSNHLFQVTATGVAPQQAYRVDGSPDLPPHWTPLITNTPSGSTLFFLDPNSAGRPRFFYRIVPWP